MRNCFDLSRIHLTSYNILLVEAEAVSYTRGSSPTLLTGIQCDGMEDHPLDCRHSTVTVHDCLRQQDAGVICGGMLSQFINFIITDVSGERFPFSTQLLLQYNQHQQDKKLLQSLWE